MADELASIREWADTLQADLTSYARDKNPEQRTISPALMLERLKPLHALLAEGCTLCKSIARCRDAFAQGTLL